MQVSKSEEESAKHKHFILIAAMTFAFSSPTLSQRGHGGGPPPGHGPSAGDSTGGGPSSNAMNHTDMSHASPDTVLNHNTAIAGKIEALTRLDAKTACGGFKNLGQCVAAAHVAKNLNNSRRVRCPESQSHGSRDEPRQSHQSA